MKREREQVTYKSKRLGKIFFIMHEMPKEYVTAHQGGPIKRGKARQRTL